MRLIKNNQPCVFGMAVKINGNHVQVPLKPGVNQVDPIAWEQIKAMPLMAKRIAAGEIEDLTPGGDAEEASFDGSIASLHHKQAVKVVESTLDKALLEGWLESDSRPVVQRAIIGQLDKLKIEPVKREESEDTFL